MSLLPRLTTPLRRLRRNTQGVAAVEFALIIPALLGIYFGAAYTSTTSTLNKKMQTAAYDMVDMVPYPRNLCTYRSFVANAFSNGLQRSVMTEMLAPFEVTNQNPVITYVEGPVDAQQLVPVTARMRYTPEPGPFRLFSSLTGSFSKTASLRGGAVMVESPAVTVKASTACPANTNDSLKILQNGVLVNDRTVSVEKMAGDSFSVPFAVEGGVPLLATPDPYRITTTMPLPPGVTFRSGGTTPNYSGVVAETSLGAPRDIYVVTMTAADYTSYLFPQPDKIAKVAIQFTVYHGLVMTVDAREQVVQMGAGQYFGPAANTKGGKPAYIYSASNVPPGLTVDENNGRLVGYATRPGSWQVTWTVKDQLGNMKVSDPVTYTVKPTALTINGPAAISTLGRQQLTYNYTADGGFGNISVRVCRDMALGRMPNSFSCSTPVATGHIDGVISGRADELGSGRITITVGDESGQTATLTVPWSVSPPSLFAYTDAPQAINGTVGQTVALRLHTYAGWGYSRVSSVEGLCCGLEVVDLGTSNSESEHTFEVRGTLNALTPASLVTVTFVDDANNKATTTFTVNVPNQVMKAWSDGPITETAGWCGTMPLFHSSGGNGQRTVLSYSGQPPGFSTVGDANNFGFTGCSSPGSGVITWIVQDATGQQASATQSFQFNTPALVAWNDGAVTGVAGRYYTYPYFHSSGGWGARTVLSVSGNPQGPGANGDANNWWLAGSASPGSGYSTVTFGDSAGQRAQSSQYWQMSYLPLSCSVDGPGYGIAGEPTRFPTIKTSGGFGTVTMAGTASTPRNMAPTCTTSPDGQGGTTASCYFSSNNPYPGSGRLTVDFVDETGARCTAAQDWRLDPRPLSATNDGAIDNVAGPYYDFPPFRSTGGFGAISVVSVTGQPPWAGARGDGRTYQFYGTSQPGSGTTTWTIQDEAGQQASASQFWRFSRPPISFQAQSAPGMVRFDGTSADWVMPFEFTGGSGDKGILGYRYDNHGLMAPLNFGIAQTSGSTAYLQLSTTSRTFYGGTVVVQVCDQYGFCPVWTFDLSCSGNNCGASAIPSTYY